LPAVDHVHGCPSQSTFYIPLRAIYFAGTRSSAKDAFLGCFGQVRISNAPQMVPFLLIASWG
jgi:hypothetical protein